MPPIATCTWLRCRNALLIGGLVLVGACIIAGGAAGTIGMNGLAVYVGNDTSGNKITGNLAEYQVYMGLSIMTTGSGSDPVMMIAQEDINQFMFLGRPMDPQIPENWYGVTPDILFSGDATHFGVKQGTGGAFVLTGPLATVTGP